MNRISTKFLPNEPNSGGVSVATEFHLTTTPDSVYGSAGTLLCFRESSLFCAKLDYDKSVTFIFLRNVCV